MIGINYSIHLVWESVYLRVFGHMCMNWGVGGGVVMVLVGGVGGQTSPSRLDPFGRRGWAKRQTAAIRERHCSKGNFGFEEWSDLFQILLSH